MYLLERKYKPSLLIKLVLPFDLSIKPLSEAREPNKELVLPVEGLKTLSGHLLIVSYVSKHDSA